MPTRRTSPRRSATRPIIPFERPSSELIEDEDDDGGSGLANAAPWLALLALVLAAGTIGYLLINRGSATSGDLTACRTAAWGAIPKANALPSGWSLGSTDLNANGITVSVMGPDPGDGSTGPVVYASVTCYGEGAPSALDANKAAATAAKANVQARNGAVDSFDVSNSATGSTTTIFRV